MCIEQIIADYKAGKLSNSDVREQFLALKKDPPCSSLSSNQASKIGSLSLGQKGLWALQNTYPGSSAYNVPICIRVPDLDVAVFRKACEHLVLQYPILTSTFENQFEDQDNMPCRVENRDTLSFESIDISAGHPGVLDILKKELRTPFDLEKGVLRIRLFTVSGQDTIVLMVVHHIIFDGGSLTGLFKALASAYGSLKGSKTPELKIFSSSYEAFVQQEDEMITSKEGRDRLSFWMEKLKGPLPVLNLPSDNILLSARDQGQAAVEGNTLSVNIPGETGDKIKSFAWQHKCYPSTFLLGAFKGMLYHYTGQQDMVIGMPMDERDSQQFGDLIGYFVNMLPIRSGKLLEHSFSGFLNILQQEITESMDKCYPFSGIVDSLSCHGRYPVFQAAFEYQNYIKPWDKAVFNDPGFSFEFYQGVHQEGEYELVLEVREDPEKGYILNFKYNPSRFKQETIRRMADHYLQFLAQVIRDPSKKIDAYTILTRKEVQTLVFDWNDTKTNYEKDQGIHDLFEVQALKEPARTAVVYEDESLTYGALNLNSTLVAKYLKTKGVKPGTLVAICVDRSLEMMTGLLGILKAGGAYVTLDPEYPSDRLSYMLEDSRAMIVLTQERLREKVAGLIHQVDLKEGALPPCVVTLDSQWEEIQATANQKDRPLERIETHHLAYVIYTSGSTGKPKGVMISHRALTNFIVSMGQTPGLSMDDRLLAVTTYCFDIVGLELYLPLIKGAQCIICPNRVTKDALALKQTIERVKPTIIQATPSTFTMLFHTGWENKEKVKILCGGEPLPDALKERFHQSRSRVWNMYGPTETTIWSTVHKLEENIPTTIGKPIANTQIYIVDANMNLLPIGVPGELCIAGDGVAQGYKNRPDLTAKQFIDNPFDKLTGRKNTRLYKTGDLARWLPDGTIEHLGRMDLQVKVRGFRIELGDIEFHLDLNDEIKESVVIARDPGDGGMQLVAYYIPTKKSVIIDPAQLKQYLKARLPEYMVPSFFIGIDNMPLTPNGKTDRKDLMGREVSVHRPAKNKTASHAKRFSDTQAKLLNIWEALLKVKNIRSTDGFFDMGGNSVLAVIASDRISKAFDCQFTPTDLFKYGTVERIAQKITGNHKEIQPEIISTPMIMAKSSTAAPLPEYYQDSMAVIGISCRFPGARNHREFWDNLCQGKESIRREMEQGVLPNFTISDKYDFDPGFFNISPKNAGFMDPQFRQLLMNSWQAVEDAGYTTGDIPDTSVFMSASNSFYQAPLHVLPNDMDASDAYVAWLSAQEGTISTMISYQLGLKGPSFSVHSNCSSSLVGLYSAWQSLKNNETNYALVGGSTLFNAEKAGYIFQKGMNFSSDGHCRPFDANADGMVAGEGAAVVLLKRAGDAIRDKDHIYALVRGVALNNDGKDKAGFYAPSVTGQSDVIEKVISATHIHPETIQYIETHGTGTLLGDPIEIRALSDVYKKFTSNQGFCKIGSVKSNIGHLDTAAGLAGLIKVCLSLENGQIPPMVNFKNSNPAIDFESSPFRVADRLVPFETTIGPARAALSSFGIGGTNSHAIFEAFQTDYDNAHKGPWMVPLSARSRTCLKKMAGRLGAFLEEASDINLNNLAFTLQTGREAMDERVAFLVDDQEELKEKLVQYSSGNKTGENTFTGSKDPDDAVMLQLKNDTGFLDLVGKWADEFKFDKFAGLWTKGLDIDWKAVYGKDHPSSRMSLPPYPFEKQEYKIKPLSPLNPISQDHGTGMNGDAFPLHPMVHQNISGFEHLEFVSVFSGEEFFLKNHLIHKLKILPGVAHLEMVRAAVELSLQASARKAAHMVLRKVVWVKPIVIKKPEQIHLRLYADNEGDISFEILVKEFPGNHFVLHSQGLLSFVSPGDKTLETLDLEALKAATGRYTISGEQCYAMYEQGGTDYGEGFRGIREIGIGEHQGLARICLPKAVEKSLDQYVLHPSIMDSAVQVTAILMSESRRVNKGVKATEHTALQGSLPFEVKEVTVLAACRPAMWAWVRYSKGSGIRERVQKMDIDLCDDQGQVCVSMRGFSRLITGENAAEGVDKNFKEDETHHEKHGTNGPLMGSPIWQAIPQDRQRVTTEPGRMEHDRCLTLVCGFDPKETQAIVGKEPHIRFVHMPHMAEDPSSSIGELFQHSFMAVFETLKTLIEENPKKNVLVQVAVPLTGEGHLVSGLSGLLATARLEHSKVLGQLIEIDPGQLVEGLEESRRHPNLDHIRYENFKPHAMTFQALEKKPETFPVFKDKGVYLVTGGAGGIGCILAKEIANSTSGVIILSSRSPLDSALAQTLDNLNAKSKVEYRPCDISKKADVLRLVRGIETDFGPMDGILHCAGVLKDNYIIKKRSDEIEAVLAPKVGGTLLLDLATKDMDLDFFILFSSVSARGSAGQADYAAANGFLDAFAQYRNTLVASKERRGQTLSIAWPLWEQGGMGVDSQVAAAMEQQFGMTPLGTRQGIQCLYRSIQSGRSRIMVMNGNKGMIRDLFFKDPGKNKLEKEGLLTDMDHDADPGLDDRKLLKQILTIVKQGVSTALDIPVSDIENDAAFDEIGFDSISLTALSNKLNQTWGLELTPTIFFEYPVVDEFAGFLAREYPGKFAPTLENPVGPKVAKPVGGQVPPFQTREKTIPRKPIHAFQKKRNPLDQPQHSHQTKDPIAIVGMSGKFPMADDLDAFWANLEQGKDCIVEIPENRWDWKALWGDPKEDSNKTHIKWGGFVNNVADFDPLFFGISPRDAEMMDPQQRLLMLHIWQAMEDAGYSRKSLSGSNTGIFVGFGGSDYSQLISASGATIKGTSVIGVSPSMGPGRVSHFMNWHGPSEAIDTACSSSLVAIHRAMLAMETMTCDTAFVGGVMTILAPTAHISFDKAGMLSKEGRCKTFSDQADGYVRGEGVGILVLKRLSQAKKDNDKIYAVLKGSAVNHGGKAGALTAPNPNAQAALLKAAYQRAGVDPHTVGCIEAHGTGTKLGDPIEINALKSAFASFPGNGSPGQTCGIGAVKTNIGHLELAAGVAGVIKVILQMKHQTLVKNLHCPRQNPYIDLSDSPFYLVKENKTWAKLQDSQGKWLPRRAGVSSFGFGGVNAHLVIEDYEQLPFLGSSHPTDHSPYLVVISARTRDRLKAYVRRILSFVENDPDILMADLVYTLQTARESMDCRLAFTAASLGEVRTKCALALEGRDEPGLIQGSVKQSRDELEAFCDDEEMTGVVDSWIDRGKIEKLAQMWVIGLDINWARLYAGFQPSRIRIPLYPFALKPYWIPENKIPENRTPAPTDGIKQRGNPYLHPLLHCNHSNFSGQNFSTTLTGQEFFLADHRIFNRKILPGVAHLEMAREAMQQSFGTVGGLQNDNGHMMVLRNIVWASPLVVAVPVQARIRLEPKSNDQVRYEIFTDAHGKQILHSQGMAVFCPKETATLDLDDLKQRINAHRISGEECYRRYEASGTHYGPGHRGVVSICSGQGQVLAKLVIPEAVRDTKEDYILHPGVMDSALQASIGLVSDGQTGSSDGVYIPFAVESLTILEKCRTSMWAWIRSADRSEDNRPGKPGAGSPRMTDIDLCDEQGGICVKIRGLASRLLKPEQPGIKQVLLCRPTWVEKAVLPQSETPSWDQHQVIVLDFDDCFKGSIGSRTNHIRFFQASKKDKTGKNKTEQNENQKNEDTGQEFFRFARHIFETIKTMVSNGKGQKILLQVILPASEETQLYSAISALMATAGMEAPYFSGQVIETGPKTRREHLPEIINENAVAFQDAMIRYAEGHRQVQTITEISEKNAPDEFDKLEFDKLEFDKFEFKDDGVYLITGGTGKLGHIFACEIAERTKDAAIILTGRSPLDTDKRKMLNAINALGARVSYILADVSRYGDVASLIQEIRSDFGRLNGIFHCAGHIKDKMIVNKTADEFTAVLAPKISGMMNLGRATREIPPDFMVVFSSLTGVTGNPGQSDYAVANAFMDRFAGIKNTGKPENKGPGCRIISINWPLWVDGGMQMDPGTLTLMARTTGITALDTSLGLTAFYRAMDAGSAQVMVMTGDIKKIREKLFLPRIENWAGVQGIEKRIQRETGAGQNPAENHTLTTAIEQVLTQIIASILKLDINDVDLDDEMSEYGFDSITLTDLSNRINLEYDLELTPTVFFEHSTIASLAGFLGHEYPDSFGLYTGSQGGGETRPTLAFKKESGPEPEPPSVIQIGQKQVQTGTDHEDAIAVIGMSGRFPMADNLDEFWENLKAGKDCICVIPESRWDWNSVYGNPLTQANKTNIKYGGFINGVYEFDPEFFSISPREALMMDPQQRLLMTYAWLAIEDAGYSAQSLWGSSTGIFVGTAGSGYESIIANANIAMEGASTTGILPSLGPNRMSYFMNFHGPSEPVETACSSSLVAVHRAVQALNSGSCDMAVVGGVNSIVTPGGHISFNKAGMLCEDGRCKTFSDKADGYVRGEGVGMLVLRRLGDAIQARDNIYGVIRGSEENHGGHANSLTSPNPKAQAALLKTVYSRAGIDPNTIGFIETHGTGTQLGDPIEINALKTAFQDLYTASGKTKGSSPHCGLGALKTNIGHLELSAGIAGMIKVLLQMKHKTLVKNLHCDTVNPYIKLEDSPFYLVEKTCQWQPLKDKDGNDIPRIAGVSSFGFGGVNAHVILEEYRSNKSRTGQNLGGSIAGPHAVILSARNKERLGEMAARLLDYLKKNPETNPADLAYTLQTGREPFEERMGFIAGSIDEMSEKLNRYLAQDSKNIFQGNARQRKSALALFSKDEQLIIALDKWIENRKLTPLVELWTQGLKLDWKRLYTGGREDVHPHSRPSRIRLPGYPFSTRRYKAGEVLNQTGLNQAPEALKQEPAASVTSLLSRKPEGVSLKSLDPVSRATDTDSKNTKPVLKLQPLEQDIVLGQRPVLEKKPEPVIQRKPLQEELILSLANALFMDPVEVKEDTSFTDMGLDSIIGVEWIKEINSQYHLQLKATVLYDHPTIREFSRFLDPVVNGGKQEANPSQGSVLVSTPGPAAEKPVVSLAAVELPESYKSPLGAAPAPAASLQPPVSPSSLAETNFLAETKILETDVITSLAQVLYIDPREVDKDKTFTEMGMDSIIGVEWVKSLNKGYGLTLKATMLYDYPDVQSFTGFLNSILDQTAVPENREPKITAFEMPFVEKLLVVHDSGHEPGTEPGPEIENVQTNPCLTPKENVSPGQDPGGKIAIIGMSGRYPDAKDLSQFWQNLKNGVDSVREVPKSRWNVDAFYDPDPDKPGKVYCKWLGALDNIDKFDPLFFNISPAEARGMDPQHRIFLEEGYKAFENAGYSPKALDSIQCGVYLGIMTSEYGHLATGTGSAGLTGGNYAIGAARLPYYLNLHGPAIPIDTACSSSLVATHLACQALKSGEIDMALAGGVSLYLMPGTYMGMCATRMVSPDGRCKTFDNSANGFVPGEGAGAVVLKRLEDAQADKDNILGVIIGSGINQDGKTNGITAPSMKSQVKLEREIYKRYQIDPETISYVEAHGTGTKLGDPIELEALSTVFGEKTRQKKYCAIGSLKTNVGHVSAAAGVAGIQKVLLCLQEKTLVPSLHHHTPNEYFDFEDSPFYVNTQAKPWVVSGGTPPRAAVSAFGFSGTNAHMVIEAYPQEPTDRTALGEQIVVLSAKTKDRLKAHVRQMLDFLEQNPELDLSRLAWTLQTGRDPMAVRLAVVTGSVADLKEKLHGMINGNKIGGNKTGGKKTVGLFQGDVGRERNAVGNITEPMNARVDSWIAKGENESLAGLWVKGMELDWRRLYPVEPVKMALPAYPFERRSFWHALPTPGVTEPLSNNGELLHPLLHTNCSDFSHQRFSSVFTGQEFFLRDHRINGQKILPGAAYLEMVRAAVELSARGLVASDEKFRPMLTLKDIVWIRPLVVGGLKKVDILLESGPGDKILFQVGVQEKEGDICVHSRGTALFCPAAKRVTQDIDGLKEKVQEGEISGSDCYEAYGKAGMDYGPAHQGVNRIYTGNGCVLAKISIRESATDTKGRYLLHPGLIDSAFQACIGLNSGAKELSVPFALDSLEIHQGCTPSMWVWIRHSCPKSNQSGSTEKLDLDICDEQGSVCIKMIGLSMRKLSPEGPGKKRTLICHQVWVDKAKAPQTEMLPNSWAHHGVIMDSSFNVGDLGEKGLCLTQLKPKGVQIDQRFSYISGLVFETIKSLFEREKNRSILLQVVIPPSGMTGVSLGLSGLLKSAEHENRLFKGQVIEMEQGADQSLFLKRVMENAGFRDSLIRYRENTRQVMILEEIKPSAGPVFSFKPGGVYLITGGAGGLGLIFARQIAQTVQNAILVLTGRRSLTPEKRGILKEIETLGAVVIYRTADVSRADEVNLLIRGIKKDFGSLNGIFHGAGVIRDNTIVNKSPAEFKTVLGPKVSGTFFLDAATRGLPLDFFVFFSSLAGVTGNPGQADYAAANGFMDTFARDRNAMVLSDTINTSPAKGPKGKTISINWPLWEEGGMQMDDGALTLLTNLSGIMPMDTKSGITAFYEAMARDLSQVIVLHGDPLKLKKKSLEPKGRHIDPSLSGHSNRNKRGSRTLANTLAQELKKIIGQLLELDSKDFGIGDEMSDYGANSLTLIDLSNRLNKKYGLELEPSVFFEHSTIQGFAGFLANTYPKISQASDDQIPNPKPTGLGKKGLFDKKTRIMDNEKLTYPPSPLSEGQKGFWILHQISPGMAAYNLPITFRVKQTWVNALNPTLFKRAVELVVLSHPILATVIKESNGVPCQMPSNATPGDSFGFEIEKIYHLAKDQVQVFLQEKSKKPFDLEAGPLLRIGLFPRSDQEIIVMIVFHHIIIDGTSAVIFMEELWEIYNALAKGIVPALAPPEIGYGDFVSWEQKMIQGEKGNAHLAYWKDELSGNLPVLTLPSDRKRPFIRTFQGSTIEMKTSNALSLKIRKVAKSLQISLPVLFLSAFKVLLYRYTGEKDLLIGMPTRGRFQPQFYRCLGYFVNMIVIRTALSGNLNFSQLAKQVHRRMVVGLDHSEYPYPSLVKELKIPQDQSVSPLYQVSYSYQNFVPSHGVKMPANEEVRTFDTVAVKGVNQEGGDELCLEIFEGKSFFTLKADYSTDLFDSKTIERMMGHFTCLLEQIVDKPDASISTYDFLPAAEKKKLLVDWNQTRSIFPKDRLIHQLFEQQAKDFPKAQAISFKNQVLSFDELNKISNQLAAHLQISGIKPGMAVGLFMERSLEMIIAVMAILKSGGVLVPLDTQFPEARVRQMIDDSLPLWVITQESLEEKIKGAAKGAGCELCVLDREQEKIIKIKKTLEQSVTANDPAYIIYTSGSTGKPKGVVISHGAILNHCQTIQKAYALTQSDRILQFAPLSVDTALEQILPGLVAGAAIVLRDDLWTPKMFMENIGEYGVSVADIPPAYLRELLLDKGLFSDTAHLKRLRLVICGGEALPAETVMLWQKSFLGKTARLLNAYGPTETTITSTLYEVPKIKINDPMASGVPIGWPLDNEVAYILDKWGNLCAIGVPGELHIGGAGVAIGYLNRPELTKEKFIKNPFVPAERMYKTGDRARRLSSGAIEFLGRMDHQVKIRGFRIEPGEIESILIRQNTIRDAAVVAKAVDGSHQLAAFLVLADQKTGGDVKKIIRELESRLPGHMIPSSFTFLADIPMTPGGKIDRPGLAKKQIVLESRETYQPPGTGTEKRLGEIWKTLLKFERVGIHDNFFDLGGHSLLSMRLISMIHDEFGVDLPVSEIIQGPSVREMALNIDKENPSLSQTPLVLIQPRGKTPPFFCVHAVGGNVLSYEGLAKKLGPERVFYGIQSPGLYGGEHPGSVEGLAKLYIESLRQVQPRGPYYLGGWSMGGIIAYEMACQLEKNNEKIELLALIDTYTPHAASDLETGYLKKIKGVTIDRETFALINFANDLGIYDVEKELESGRLSLEFKKIMAHIHKRAGKPGFKTHPEKLTSLFEVFRTNTMMMNAYQPADYQGRAVLFQGKDEPFIDEKSGEKLGEKSRGWQSVLGEKIDIVEVKGTHYTLLHKTGIQSLAEQLKPYLD